MLSDYDLHLFGRGVHYRLWEKFGAHFQETSGGTHFAVWAPNARNVSVIGDFNNWDGSRHVLRCLGDSGVWETLVPEARPGACYKFLIHAANGEWLEKMDPMAGETELRPRTASVIPDPKPYPWKDSEWESNRSF